MQPIFDITTAVSMEEYRRALKDSIKLRKIFLPISVCIFVLLWCVWSLFTCSDSIVIDFSLILNAFIIGIDLSLIHFFLKLPKKTADKYVAEMQMKTGCLYEIKYYQHFFDSEIITENFHTGNKFHIPYSMVQIITDYKEFIIISNGSAGVYLNKKDIPDNKAFYDFIWSKCPQAKYKQKDRRR